MDCAVDATRPKMTGQERVVCLEKSIALHSQDDRGCKAIANNKLHHVSAAIDPHNESENARRVYNPIVCVPYFRDRPLVDVLK